MKRRNIVFAAIGALIIIIIAGILYTSHFANAINQTQSHVAQGAATVTGTATSTIYMTDFGIQPPNLANIAISQNKVVIALDFTAKSA